MLVFSFYEIDPGLAVFFQRIKKNFFWNFQILACL